MSFGHKLPDKIYLNARLLVRFADEAMLGYRQVGYDATMQLANGRLVEHEVGHVADPIRKMIARDILMHANKHIAHDGAWACCWIGWQNLYHARNDSHYARLVFLWMDKDGDVQFPVEIEEDLPTYSDKGILHWVEQLAQAWQHWNHLMVDVLAPKESQKIQLEQKAVGSAHGLH